MQTGRGEDKFMLNLTTTLADNGVILNKQPSVGRNAIQITTTYELVDRSTGKILTKGTTFARVPYDTVRQPFADMQAQKDATERAAREVGVDIRTRLAAYFAKQQQSS
jgi:LPS-assembly lipoprotein